MTRRLPGPGTARDGRGAGVIAALAIGLGACAAWVAILTLSDRDPRTGPWPPEHGNWTAAAWSWGLTILIYVGLFQAWAVPQGAWAPMIWALALSVGLLGTAIQSWGMWDLGFRGTSGWDVGVVRTGAYRLSRHPQYLGQALGFLGFAILLGHATGWVIALAAISTLVYASRVEDRAMAARHPGFAAYRAATPFLVPPRRP